MRAFRFRLAPLQRIKRYNIEEKEREIARLQARIEEKLEEISVGRNRLEAFRRMFLEETPEIHSTELEQTEAAFRAYTFMVERNTYQEIERIRTEQGERRKELVSLYQEEKMLERLKERQRDAWRKEAEREELYLLDELGGQAHYRRKQAGGAMLVMLGFLALLGAAGATVVLLGKHKPILERFGLLQPKSAGEEVVSATETARIPGELTIRDLYGDPDRPANEVLNELLEMSQTIREKRRLQQERENRLAAEREALEQSEEALEQKLENVQKKLAELEKKQQEELERAQSMHMQRVTEVSNSIQRMKAKGAADLFTEMWKTDPAEDPDAQQVVLDVFRAIPSNKRNKILDALVKASKKDTAAMILEFIKTDPGTQTASTEPSTQGSTQ